MSDLLQPPHCVSNCLHQTARAVARIYTEEMKPAGIRRSQYTILAYLDHLKLVQLSGLADKLFMDRTTLSRNLRPLERDGFVSIQASPLDARARDLSLTKEGKAKFKEATKYWRRAQKRVIQAFGDGAWVELETRLKSLRELAI